MSGKHKFIAEKSLQKEIELSVPPHSLLIKIKVKEALELAAKARVAAGIKNTIANYEKVIPLAPKFPLPYFCRPNFIRINSKSFSPGARKSRGFNVLCGSTCQSW